jgi:hypothetical protein
MTLNQAWNEYEAACNAYKANPSQANDDRLSRAEEQIEGLQDDADFDAANAGDFMD